MENQNFWKPSDQSGFSQQRAFGTNLSNVSTPLFQLKGDNDQNDKIPAFGSGIQDKDESIDTNSSGSPGLFKGGPLPIIKDESMDTNSSGSPGLFKGGPLPRIRDELMDPHSSGSPVIYKGGPFSEIKDGPLSTKTPGSPGNLEDRPFSKIKDGPLNTKTPGSPRKLEDRPFSKIKDGPLNTKTPESPGKFKDRPVLKRRDQSMDTKTPCTSQKFKDEPLLKIKDVPKPTIKEEGIDNETITVYVRGPGNQRKPLQISRNASIDDLISRANAAFGFGHKPSNTYIVHSGKDLVNGTGQTVAKAGIQNYGELNLCVRNLGGQHTR